MKLDALKSRKRTQRVVKEDSQKEQSRRAVKESKCSLCLQAERIWIFGKKGSERKLGEKVYVGRQRASQDLNELHLR